MRFLKTKLIILTGLLLAANPASAVEKISLQALFKDKAIIVVDGARRILKSGEESPEGVKLLATDTQEEKAEIEIGGKREVLKLGVVIAGFASKGKGSVILYPETSGHYFVEGLVNGVPVRFMVDTGATIIGMNSIVANRIGLDYRKQGRPGFVNTAGGTVPTYYIKLNNVTVGDITLYNVDASIVEGSSPREALLGMSFLGHLNMKRDSEKMELSEH
ncbi:MAG: retroviral-like aspartic protease family protein [Sulfuricaulis sp.]|uniref:retropepsin-like aspartic protease family protein n=1 Tax=Sulfuricaulis sp. TaxID=2003553 RepID=UPI0025DAC7C0|nr:retropepsin-like aspartic protease [Sulfuricaulis sp.]MCR4347588.1 retroviral-like aspartic protease family protein [Sulfuricaulis sp.]